MRLGISIMALTAVTLSAVPMASSKTSCAAAKAAETRAQSALSKATRDKNQRASALHRCVSRAKGKNVCQAQQKAFAAASARHADATLGLKFARSQREAACR